jgi:hypothetical protein
VIDGYDGEQLTDEEHRGRVRADMDRQFPGGWQARWDAGDREVRDAFTRTVRHHVFVPVVVGYHNRAVDAACEYAGLDVLVSRGRWEVDQLYRDLDKNTTVNWLAAHHRFVKTAVSLRDILTRRVAAARSLAEGEFGQQMTDPVLAVYEQVVPAGQRITVPDVDEAELALTEFVEKTRERIDLLRATVTGGYPEGFAPPRPAPSPPAVSVGADPDWDDNWPASHAVVAGREQRW